MGLNALFALTFHVWVGHLITLESTLSSTVHQTIANITYHCAARSCLDSDDSIPCYCDTLCEWFGDCCGDYNRTQEQPADPYVSQGAMLPNRSLLECVQPCGKSRTYCFTDSVPMITGCPTGNLSSPLEKALANNCSTSTSDLPPVTDNTTGIVYRNIYCVLCNGIPIGSTVEWHSIRICKNPAVAPENGTDYDVNLSCSVFNLSYIPPYLENHTQRRCSESLVTACPNTLVMNDSSISSVNYDELVNNCTKTGVDVVMSTTDGRRLHYANPYCAACNIGITDTLTLSCSSVSTTAHVPTVSFKLWDKIQNHPVIHHFFILPPIVTRIEYPEIILCINGTVFDPHLMTCREELLHFIPQPIRFSEPDHTKVTKSNASYKVHTITDTGVCNGSYIALEETEYMWLLFNETLLWMSNNETYFIAGFHNTGDPIICVNLSQTHSKTIDSTDFTGVNHQLALDILSYIGLGLDIVSGIFILITYCAYKDLQTLYGKLLINMVIIIIVNNVSLVIGYPISKIVNNTGYCTAISIIFHYVFLSRFLSCSALFFEATRTFYHALKVIPAREKSRKQVCKYLCLYIIPIYTISGMIVLSCILLNFTLEGSIGYGYSATLCWMSSRIAIGVTFVAPLCLTLVLNCYCFIFCTLVVIKLSAPSKATKEKCGRKDIIVRNFRVITAFFSVSGISWICFVLVMIPGVDGRRQVWGSYIFVILNSSQLILVALAFVCTKKVLKKYSSTARNRAIQLSRCAPSLPRKEPDTLSTSV